MNGRYELVAVDYNKRGQIIQSKNKKKLTLQDADIFTSLFNNKEELTYYLRKKEYINYNPKMYVLLYKANKKLRYLDCLYKEDEEIIKLARSSKKDNKINTYNRTFGYLLSFLIRNADTNFVEYAYHYKYINKYVFDKLIEYRHNKSNLLVKSIERELSKEYLQTRKLYSIVKIYKNNKMNKKVTGESEDPYIQYLIDEANKGNENAFEELKQMDLEKTLGLKM